MKQAIIILVIVGAALAGCVGSEDTEPGPSGLAADPTPTDESGSIEGLILDDQLLPIPGVEVLIQPEDNATLTDADGRFVFNGLDAGKKTLFAQKLGYEALAKTADVIVGDVTVVEMTLDEIIAVTPYEELYIHEMNFALGLAVPVVTVNPLALYNPGNHKVYTETNATLGLEHSVTEAVWQDNGAFSSDLRIVQNLDGDTQGEAMGPSPVRYEETSFKKVEEDSTIGHRAWVAWADAAGGEPVRLALEQRFTLYVSLFYHQEAPEEYSAIP